MPDPNLFTARALRQVLAEAGIAITGTTRSTTDSMLYRQARSAPPLAEISSRPFRDWVFPILNRSQNWFAEMLLKQLGRQFGRAGSWDGGAGGGAPLPDRFGPGRLDRVLAAGRLRASRAGTW